MSTPEGPAVTARIETWTWILVYVGMVLVPLGLSVQRTDAVLGWGIAAPGIAAIAVGIALIWIRSRITNPKTTSNNKETT